MNGSLRVNINGRIPNKSHYVLVFLKLCYTIVPFLFLFLIFISVEAVAQRCSVIKVFLEISQNSQEHTCARYSSFNKVERVLHTPVSCMLSFPFYTLWKQRKTK